MQNKKYIFILLLLVFDFHILCGNNLRFIPIQSTSNLQTNEVRKLYQDSEGYLWISTYSGLVRYDGYDYVVFKTDPTTHKQVLNSFVNLCAEDSHHQIWIGTHSGLYKLDKSTDNITKIDVPGLADCRVEAIVPSSFDESIWVATNKGLYVKENKDTSFVYCDKQWNIPTTDMKSLIEDKNGQLWIGTWSEGLIRYDVQHKRAYRYNKIPALKSSHTIFIDKADNVWVGTWGQGLIRLIDPYNMDRQSYVHYKYDDVPGGLLDSIIYSIAQEPMTGQIWVGTRSGLSILHDVNNVRSFANYTPINNTLPYNEINAILATSDNSMWIGSLGGGVFMTKDQQTLVQTDDMPEVLKRYGTNSAGRILEDHNSHDLWIGVNGFGLVLYNLKSGNFKSYQDIPALRKYAQLQYIQDMQYSHTTDDVLFATEKGIICYNRSANFAREISNDTGTEFKDNYISRLYTDSKDQIWVATRAGVGVLTDDYMFIPIDSMIKSGDSMGQIMVFDISEDSNGILWFITPGHGIFRYNPMDMSSSHYSIDNRKLFTEGGICSLVDTENRLWVGSELGLLKFDEKCNCFEVFKGDVLPFYGGGEVNNIWEDNAGDIWMATNNGILQMHIQQEDSIGYLYLYSKEDGLLDSYFHRNAICQLDDNSVIVASAHGLNHITPQQVLPTNDNSRLAITDFKIHGESITELPRQIRDKLTPYSLSFSNRIVLPYNMNNFTIYFSLLNYNNSVKNRYSYQLEGYDASSIQTDSQHRMAHYNNLPAGLYTFVVRGANSNGVWCNAEKRIQIKILSPWWRTWWAYCLYSIMILLLIGGIGYMLTSSAAARQELKLAEIDKHKSEEINHLKLQFFTNITHELLTPLSIILAAVEELNEEDSAEATKSRYAMITDNAMRLVRLIQQILEFRKAESGNLKLRVSKGNITEFVNHCIDSFQPLARKQKLQFFFDSDSSDDIFGYFDYDKLDKIVYNLLSNAAKYNHENGQIYVNLNERKDNHSIILQITDTGIGMKPEEMDNLFKRFYDGDYRKKHTIGTGIGLSLVKDLVTLHHGTINVKSVYKEGSTFIVEIPISRDFYAIEEIDTELAEAVVDNDKKQNKAPSIDASILIVEDNVDLLDIMWKYLSNRYNTVLKAASAEEALTLMESAKDIDLIISDIMMPGMNGYDFCAHVKNEFQYSHVPVILITARQTSMDQIMAYEVGADGYVTKPLNIGVLNAKIKSLLQKKNSVEVDRRKQMVFEATNINYTPEDEKFMHKAIECVNNHIADSDFTLADFATEMCVSRSTLNERIKTMTGMSPFAFVNDIRLHTAYNIVKEKGKMRISDLAFAVGFNDPKYFSTLFKKKFGHSPHAIVKEDAN